MPFSILYEKNRKNYKMSISIRYGKNIKIAKCLSQLGMKKHINRKMHILIRYGKNAKKCKMPISNRYGKTKKSQNA